MSPIYSFLKRIYSQKQIKNLMDFVYFFLCVICYNQKLCDDFCQLFTAILDSINLKIKISYCFINKIKVGMDAAV